MIEVVSFRNELYNIVHLDNIPGIIQHGILCHELAEPILHKSVALDEVQARRAKKRIPQGKELHEYANLYINPRNPMMCKRQDICLNLCVLSIDKAVLQFPGVVVSDRNAACDMCRFMSPDEALRVLDFSMIYARYWTHHPDNHKTDEHRSISCAEVLIPERVPYEFVTKAYVAGDEVKTKLRSLGFDKPIEIDPDMFFR